MKFPPPFYRWRPHPWHGLEPGPDPPRVITAFIEITPFDGVKYELDKKTGFLRVDRPPRQVPQARHDARQVRSRRACVHELP
jgi:inorganic pyrophosphatase